MTTDNQPKKSQKYHKSEILAMCQDCPDIVTNICNCCEEISGVECENKRDMSCISIFLDFIADSGISIQLITNPVRVELCDDPICARCGERRHQLLHKHHVNQNRKDNRPENLLLLCANCHTGLHSGLWKLQGIEYTINGTKMKNLLKVQRKIQRMVEKWEK